MRSLYWVTPSPVVTFYIIFGKPLPSSLQPLVVPFLNDPIWNLYRNIAKKINFHNIIDQIKKKLVSKFSLASRSASIFGPIWVTFMANFFFPKNPALWRATLYEFLTLFQNLVKNWWYSGNHPVFSLLLKPTL